MRRIALTQLFAWSVLLHAAACANAATATVDFLLTEATPGRWGVSASVTGETAGLAGFAIDVMADPGQVTWTPHTLSVPTNVVDLTISGFTMNMSGAVGSGPDAFFSVGAAQSLTDPIFDIGLAPMRMTGAGYGDPIDLGAPALLGTISAPTGLTAADFRIDASLYDTTRTATGFLGSEQSTVLIGGQKIIPPDPPPADESNETPDASTADTNENDDRWYDNSYRDLLYGNNTYLNAVTSYDHVTLRTYDPESGLYITSPAGAEWRGSESSRFSDWRGSVAWNTADPLVPVARDYFLLDGNYFADGHAYYTPPTYTVPASDPTIPEPATAALLLLTGIGVLTQRR